MGSKAIELGRGAWAAHLDFIMSAVSYAVGLGNIWRFPYLCYRNGGGAFLVPYLTILFLAAIPLLFQQMALGQFCSRSSLACRTFSPIFKGIGYYNFGLAVLAIGYYNVIVSWAWYYLFVSLRSVLPWQSCSGDWYSDVCSTRLPDVNCTVPNMTAYDNGTCYDGHGSMLGVWDYSVFVNQTGSTRTLPSEEYFSNRLLRVTSGIEDMGTLRWENALICLWSIFVVFLCLIRGIKTAGKVSYVLCLLPYAILLVLLVRALLLPNAVDGILYYLIPRWERLKDIRVWYDAAAQIFYSIGVGGGIAISLSSYNNFSNNVLRDVLLVSFFNTICSLLSGFVIFSFLGFLAAELNSKVEDVATAGPGLAFVIFPELVTRMPLSPLWSVLFFIVLIMLGLGTALGSVEHFVACILDELPSLRKCKIWVTACICGGLFLVGLPMCMEGGVYILQIFDHYLISYGTVITVLLENISIAWVYGAGRLLQDCTVMLGYRPSVWWKICWQASCPCLITFILIMMVINHTPVRYGLHYYYPMWADVTGWVMILATLLIIPIYAVYKISTLTSGSIIQRVKEASRPAAEWGPALVSNRRLVDYAEGFVVDPWGLEHEMEKLHTAENGLANGTIIHNTEKDAISLDKNHIDIDC